jgi:hypothetical protein
MIHHDEYGKRLMGLVAGHAFVPNRKISYGGILSDDDIKPKIDGVVGETVAVEIQAGWSKAARGAILDLICSDEYPSKLLLVIDPPAGGGYAAKIARHCGIILGRFLRAGTFRVVLLRGNGDITRDDDDTVLIRSALRGLGWTAPA